MAAGKPTVYLDTPVVSMLFLRAFDMTNASRQILTREWWEEESRFFRVFASDVVEDEISGGRFQGQELALAFVQRLPYLAQTQEVASCARVVVARGLIPDTKMGDAVHLAIAIAHRMDYLMTWNYAHLANPATQRRVENVCAEEGWRVPLLVSPENIPSARRGDIIRRRDRHEG
jgi:hypothetical protein